MQETSLEAISVQTVIGLGKTQDMSLLNLAKAGKMCASAKEL